MSIGRPEDARPAEAGIPIAEALRRGAARLEAAGIDRPRLEARLLLAHALGCATTTLTRDPRALVPTEGYDTLIARRAAREPLAYITGEREFWSLGFAVSPATLIPRPDSETVIEAALEAFAGGDPPGRILDLGTGTGCLLLAALHAVPGAFGVGVDRSFEAARLAARNAARLDLAHRAGFLCGDWAAALDARFDLVLSNPPYIPTSVLATLMPEVARHEPHAALDGGADGLMAYRAIMAALPRLMRPTGVAVLELGIDQADSVGDLARHAGLVASFRADLAGIARAVVLRRART